MAEGKAPGALSPSRSGGQRLMSSSGGDFAWSGGDKVQQPGSGRQRCSAAMKSLLSLNLPLASGPLRVACADVMVGAGKEGSFFRLFYPCTPSSTHQQLPPTWVPRAEYLAGSNSDDSWIRKTVFHVFSAFLGSPTVPVLWDEIFMPGKDRIPLIIFSHGLASFRTAYSSLCSELASYGFLVVALEHRDGSAYATYHFEKMSPGYSSKVLQEVWVPHKNVLPGMKEFYLRNYQVHHRANECVSAVRILQDIDAGRTVSNILNSGFSLDSLQGRIDFSRVAVMGHSFGGATSLMSLTKDDIFRCAVVLDPWMFPLEDTCYPYIQKPILCINTEKFQTTQSVQKIMRLNSAGADLKYLTVRGCVHDDQSDIGFISGYLANKIQSPRGTMDPNVCLKISVISSLDFLNKHLGLAVNGPQLESLSAEIKADILPGFPVVNTSKL